jgi:hypothetical protein
MRARAMSSTQAMGVVRGVAAGGAGFTSVGATAGSVVEAAVLVAVTD